jgi:DNA repair exonuclease SbcCD ATPase subunit
VKIIIKLTIYGLVIILAGNIVYLPVNSFFNPEEVLEQEEDDYTEEEAIDEEIKNQEKEALDALKNSCLPHIDKRINSLNRFRNKIQELERISEQDREQILSQIDSALNNLNSLKSTVTGYYSTDKLDELESLVTDALDDLSVYSTLIPKLSGLSAINIIEEIKENDLDTNISKLESAIDKLESEGHDVEELESFYNNLSEEMGKLENNLQSATDDLNTVTWGEENNQNTNRNRYSNAKQYITQARENLVEIKKVVNNIAIELKSFAE